MNKYKPTVSVLKHLKWYSKVTRLTFKAYRKTR